MRLRTKLVLVTTALMFGIVLILSALFLGELLRQRIEQTLSANDVLAHEVLLSTRHAIENGLLATPPIVPGEEAFQTSVADALRADEALKGLMDSIVRYSPTVQDVSIAASNRSILVSTDPAFLNTTAPYRTLLSTVKSEDIVRQTRTVFGTAQVLDLPLALERNGTPFLTIHLGVRSSLLRNSYAPLLRAALLFATLAIVGCIVAAALLSTAALRPIEQISRQLETLTLRAPGATHAAIAPATDTVLRVADSINRLGEQLQTSERQQSALESNLNKMLHTLKDGVLLFTYEGRAVMASEALANFLPMRREAILNRTVDEIFPANHSLDTAVRRAFLQRSSVVGKEVVLHNGRTVELSIDFIRSEEAGDLGALLTLHDAETELELGREIEVARRLAAIGRLTAGVGHEVKNPINAMVVHLELLRGKLASAAPAQSAMRHVEILSSEMQRLDRVVQTLADFSRPLELQLQDCDLREIIRTVLDLASVEMEQSNVQIESHTPAFAVIVRIDADLIRQAILNILLNADQAMPQGGLLHLRLVSDQHAATLSIRDQGTGIPVDVRSRVFDLYFTTKPRGSGIGLAMTYRIVQLHGGSLDFTTQTAEESAQPGTEFRLRLPLAHKLSAAQTI